MGLEPAPTPPRTRGRPRRSEGQGTARKPHEQIGLADALNFSEALNFARRIGREPNLWVTVQWRHAESARTAPERVRRLLNLIGVFLRRKAGLPAVWAYAREVGLRKSEHLHLLVHVPDRLQSEFRRKLWDWIEREAMEVEGVARSTALRVDRISDGGIHQIKRYCLKDGTDETRRRFDVPNTSKYRRTPAVILGKRLKVSHAIDRAARRASPEGVGPPSGFAATYVAAPSAEGLQRAPGGHSDASKVGGE